VTNLEIGIFSRTFTQATLEEILNAVAVHGLSHVHFNLSSTGVANLPDENRAHLCTRIGPEFETHSFVMPSVLGAFDAIHPNTRHNELDRPRACRVIDRRRQTDAGRPCQGS
jgi:hypothetical protein